MAIALVGARGAGKTTVGRALARVTGRAFVDLDDEVERHAGATISHLLTTRGEDAFRALEVRALREVLDRAPGAVIATGGGTPTRDDARALLRARTTVVYLRAAPEVLAARVVADAGRARPALRPGGPLAEARLIVAEREPVYRDVARHVVDASRDVDEVVASIIDVMAGDSKEG